MYYFHALILYLRESVPYSPPPHIKIPNFAAEKTCLQSGAKSGFGLYN